MLTSKLNRIPSIKVVMTPFPYSIDIGDPPAKAQEMMDEHNIHRLPVTADSRLVGVITDKDLKRYSEQAVRDPSELLKVKDLYQPDVCTVDLNEPLDEVLLRMARDRIESTLVLRQEKLVGIFTVTDACRTFAEVLQSLFPKGDDDIAA